jgi:hypothetical protein
MQGVLKSKKKTSEKSREKSIEKSRKNSLGNPILLLKQETLLNNLNNVLESVNKKGDLRSQNKDKVIK